MQQWQPGYKLKNRPYEILNILGEGGFGITYKAKNLSLDVPVVIKTPNSKLQRDKNYSKYLESFKKEAKQLAKLGMNPHPHIVRVFDFFEEDNLPCIIMDYVPGNSLYDLVQMNGVLSEERALEYIRQIGSALEVCHQQGIIHRDVHPNNILIHGNSGKAILIDFGISGSTQTSRSNRSGNQAFAPWEQLISFGEQSSKTPQVDIYTLAASFYYLITGDSPTPSLARKFNNDDLIEPKQHNSKISDRINQVILKGLEIEPGDRPHSVQQWLDLLKPTKPEKIDTDSPTISVSETIQKEETKPTVNFANRKNQDKTIIDKLQADIVDNRTNNPTFRFFTKKHLLIGISITGIITTIFGLTTYLFLENIINNSAKFNSPETISANNNQKFHCEIKSNIPTLIAKDSLGRLHPIMEWTKEKYFYSKHSANNICQNLSKRFNDYDDNDQLKMFTLGNINDLGVICTVKKEEDPCTEKNILYTLEPHEDPMFHLLALKDLGSYSGKIISR